MKVFAIITGASQPTGRAFGHAFCDESLGLTHLRAFLVDEHLKSLESTGISINKKALTCKSLLSMYKMDLKNHKELDKCIDDILVEITDQFDKILLIHAGSALGRIEPLLKATSIEKLAQQTDDEGMYDAGANWLSVRFARHIMSRKLTKKATIVHLSQEENAVSETDLAIRMVHHMCNFDLKNYEGASIAAEQLAKQLINR